MFLNVLGKYTMKDLCDKLGSLHASKSLVNNIFL